MGPASLETEVPVEGPLDLGRSLSLLAMGRLDPCLRMDPDGAVRMGLAGPSGPLRIELRHDQARSTVVVRLDGADAAWAVPALPDLIGAPAPRFESPARLAELSRRLAGLRIPRVPLVLPRAVQMVLQQQIAFYDACAAWSGLVERFGSRPFDDPDLHVPPDAAAFASIRDHQFSAIGLLPKLGRRVVALAREGRALERDWDRGLDPSARERVLARAARVPGVGAWTLSMLAGAGLGDPDALVLGDYALPDQAAHFFCGERKGTDALLTELLEPHRPHRFHVIALLWKSGIRPERRAPRQRPLRDRMRR